MKHPIYDNEHERGIIEIIKDPKLRESLHKHIYKIYKDTPNGEAEANAFLNRMNTYVEIEKNGCNLIQLKKSSDWDESLSKKTIEKMEVKDIKLPFKAFTIDLKSASWTIYDEVHIAADEDIINIIFCRNDNNGTFFHNWNFEYKMNVLNAVNKIIESNYAVELGMLEAKDMMLLADGTDSKEYDEKYKAPIEAREMIYKVISIIMYVSMFKRDSSRVEEVKTVNKGSNKRSIPTHTTNTVYLSQPTYKLEGKSKGSHKQSEHIWMVKGYWRSQPYGKRDLNLRKEIWIDSFWKGKGAKQLQRVYKV